MRTTAISGTRAGISRSRTGVSRTGAGALLAAAAAAVILLLVTVGASAAAAATVGIVPPRNPTSDCDRGNIAGGRWGITKINACRAMEGVGPMRLPTNWRSLSPVEQGFVLIDLERVNRGLAPILGLSPSLNRLAIRGAERHGDPPFPKRGFRSGGGIWAGAGSVLTADYLWMYDDGPHGLDANVECPSAGGAGCWGHRDIILWDRTRGPLVAGGGVSGSPGDGSYAYLVLAGYSRANLTFTWRHELRFFTARPRVEPLLRRST